MPPTTREPSLAQSLGVILQSERRHHVVVSMLSMVAVFMGRLRVVREDAIPGVPAPLGHDGLALKVVAPKFADERFGGATRPNLMRDLFSGLPQLPAFVPQSELDLIREARPINRGVPSVAERLEGVMDRLPLVIVRFLQAGDLFFQIVNLLLQLVDLLIPFIEAIFEPRRRARRPGSRP